ncbi:uncharacterized protein E0L32_002232 [Thyridium curvatum]|uniref:Uncharacterized protein n=1 Tax=Thyridium curvatum TaxID=1093900 RepID=A0A507AKB5_9PEZI|nr:uncharacterized protein E0L32_002232 [Thyridium curvatum]TPX06736.1 hypothetical protein E0L32_002232 [Thyridium curvatum]
MSSRRRKALRRNMAISSSSEEDGDLVPLNEPESSKYVEDTMSPTVAPDTQAEHMTLRKNAWKGTRARPQVPFGSGKHRPVTPAPDGSLVDAGNGADAEEVYAEPDRQRAAMILNRFRDLRVKSREITNMEGGNLENPPPLDDLLSMQQVASRVRSGTDMDAARPQFLVADSAGEASSPSEESKASSDKGDTASSKDKQLSEASKDRLSAAHASSVPVLQDSESTSVPEPEPEASSFPDTLQQTPKRMRIPSPKMQRHSPPKRQKGQDTDTTQARTVRVVAPAEETAAQLRSSPVGAATSSITHSPRQSTSVSEDTNDSAVISELSHRHHMIGAAIIRGGLIATPGVRGYLVCMYIAVINGNRPDFEFFRAPLRQLIGDPADADADFRSSLNDYLPTE